MVRHGMHAVGPRSPRRPQGGFKDGVAQQFRDQFIVTGRRKCIDPHRLTKGKTCVTSVGQRPSLEFPRLLDVIDQRSELLVLLPVGTSLLDFRQPVRRSW